jgi:hypothetical protein
MSRSSRADDMEFAGDNMAAYDSRKAGGGIMALAVLLALLWLGGAGAFIYGYIGLDAVLALQPAIQAALGVISILPAFLILFAGMAAREGARARAESHRLSAAAEKLLSPAPAAEAAARRLGVSVRGEIAALERAIDQALKKAKEVEALIARQTQSMDGAVNAAQFGAEQMLAGMERERGALLQIADDLNNQAGLIGDSISRHTKLIGEAARLAESEIRAADEVLDARLSSFGAAAALISDRTGALTKAAQASSESALRLESVLGDALQALTKATSLTDAARQSAEAATFAANNTAGAVRETTVRAVEDAKRAADLIRSEAAAVEREAGSALERLKEAAEAARAAAQNARTASVAAAAAPEAARARPAPTAPPEPRLETPNNDRVGERLAGIPPRPIVTVSPRPPNDPGAQHWTWREVLAAIEDEPGRKAEPPRRASPAKSTEPPPTAEPRVARHPLPVVNVIESAGLRLDEVFNLAALDKVAQRARNGTQARRRAVRDAAPEAVRRLSGYLDRDRESRSASNEFLRSEGVRIAELLGRGRASMSADATRAFLLIDAAAA